MPDSIIQTIRQEIGILFGKDQLGPSYPQLPELDHSTGETERQGIYIRGDAAGNPLIKIALNEGYEFIESIAEDLEADRDKGEADFDLIIVGCGATGFAAANRAHERGISYLAIDSGRFCELIQNFTKGKPLFNEPHSLPQKGSIWFEECSKEELLERWSDRRKEIALNLHEYEKVVDIKGSKGRFEVQTDKSNYTAARILISIGKSGNPRKAGVPGEQEYAEKVFHFLADPDVYDGRNILVYGGGDVAAEACLALAGTNRVTLATIDERFIFPKKRNADALLQLQDEGKLDIRFDTRLKEIGPSHVTLIDQHDNTETTLDNEVVFEMIGSVSSIGFFKKIGIRPANSWTGNPWLAATIALASLTLLSIWAKAAGLESTSLMTDLAGITSVILLGTLVILGVRGNKWSWLGFTLLVSYIVYAAKASTPRFPFHWIGADRIAEYLASGWIGSIVPDAVAAFQGAPSFWYSALYTVLVVYFGIRAMRRWGHGYGDNHQKWRYVSIIAFQVVFFIVVNMILSVIIGKYYWRGWGLYQPFPLFYNTFFWWYPEDPATVKWLFIGTGTFLTLVFIPIFVRYHGMRFCTWVCGCGGLAETFGDMWRHYAPKGLRSRKWEFMGPVVLVWSVVSLAVIILAHRSTGNNFTWHSYDYIVDFWLVAVIPIGLYPFFGGKIWCRYWCPLAHYMKFLSKWYGKLRIVSNSKCISCTQCSKYCQVGVDVMEFAKNQVPFDNTNSSCIHCGICITVCPVDVLSFDTYNRSEPPLPAEPGLKLDKSSGVSMIL